MEKIIIIKYWSHVRYGPRRRGRNTLEPLPFLSNVQFQFQSILLRFSTLPTTAGQSVAVVLCTDGDQRRGELEKCQESPNQNI